MENSHNTNWTIDSAHSDVTFKVKHMMISTVAGQFEDFQATIKSDGDNFNNASFEFSAKTASINTKNSDRDNHLKSADFFSSEQYPDLKFISKSFDGETLVGDLTMKDVTKEVRLDATFNGIAVDMYGQTKAGFEFTGEVSRKDFNLTWNAITEAGSVVVSDKVKLIIDAQFIKQAV